jgi:hypothetical protein
MMRVVWATPICRFMSAGRINDPDSRSDVAVGVERLCDRVRGSMSALCLQDRMELRGASGIIAVRLRRRG